MDKINAQPATAADRDLLGDRLRLRGELALLGWPSLRAWARHHGYLHTAVHHALKTLAVERGDRRRPHGVATAKILCDLRRTISERVSAPEVCHD